MYDIKNLKDNPSVVFVNIVEFGVIYSSPLLKFCIRNFELPLFKQTVFYKRLL